jgi:RNA polymerase primary sigma factor
MVTEPLVLAPELLERNERAVANMGLVYWWSRQGDRGELDEAERFSIGQLALLRGCAAFDQERGELGSLLGTSIARAIRHEVRKRQGRTWARVWDGDGEFPDPADHRPGPEEEVKRAEEEVTKAEESREVERQLSLLPARERRVVEEAFGLRDGVERSYAEIGERIGVSRERVSQLASRAIATMRAAVGAEASPWRRGHGGPRRRSQAAKGGGR